ncbi:MAG: hypothetical protein ACYTG1_12955 [Planctomycetota bacterium]|jgi:hypothetical protein
MTACALLTAAAALGGCGGSDPAAEDAWLHDGSEFDRAAVQSQYITHIDAAVIRAQTLFAYHFVQNSAQLNELGERDVGILGRHYHDHPGRISVRRGGVGDELYDARVATVIAGLASYGVDTSRVEVTDSLAGGDGLSTYEVLIKYGEMVTPSSNGSDSGSDSGMGTSDGRSNYDRVNPGS